MKKDQNLLIFKIIAVSAALLYLYKSTKANGGTMAGKYNPEAFANLGAQLFPAEYRGHVRKYGTQALTKLIQ